MLDRGVEEETPPYCGERNMGIIDAGRSVSQKTRPQCLGPPYRKDLLSMRYSGWIDKEGNRRAAVH
jgi:hypothetical protein